MAIVSTGQITITDVNDAVSARLSNEFSGVPTNADGSGGDFTGCSTTITVNQGLQDITANGWSITALPSAGVSGTLVGQTYTVTGLSVDSGYVDLRATHSNGDALSKRFTVTKVKKGEAGALITLVPTSQGFFFKDGAAEPDTQTIGFMVIRQNTEAKVTFEASDGVSLLTDEGYLDAAQYADGIYGQGQGDICYLSVAAFGNRKQVTVTAKAGSLASSVTILRLDESSAEPGATRNVFRGALSYGQAYLVGDTVISDGYGWSCIQAHFSEEANRPPPYPATENTWWALASVKGADALNAVLSNEAFVFPAGSDGAVSSYTGSGTAVRVYEGAEELLYDGVGTSSGTWKVATSATNITVGSLTDSGTYLTVGQHSGVANGTDTASITYTITGKTKAGVAFTLMKVQNFAKSKSGYSAITGLLSNEAHVFPAATDGTVSTYANSGTEVRVYEGATELVYDGVGTSNGTWKATVVGANITAGTLTDSGTFLTVGTHTGVAAGTDTSELVYTITGKSAVGTAFTITKKQTFSKSKAGATGATGAQGPSVVVTPNRALAFTATNGTLDAAQADIVFTAAVSGVSSPTYVWSFSGFESAPTNSGTATQTITAAHFGNAKNATVTCTVSGTYKDVATIVRLEVNTSDAVKANGALQKAGDAITGPVTFATNGGILAATDADNGVFMGPNGLVGKKAGATTFAIDTAGNASFGGTLNANAINAVDTINIAGNAVTTPAGVEYLSPNAPNNGTNFTSAGTVCSTPSADFKSGSVMVSLTMRVSVPSYSMNSFYVEIYRSGVLIKSYSVYNGSDVPQSHAFAFIDSPGSGLKNYAMKIYSLGDVSGSNGAHVFNASIQALGVFK